jgi:hypothetical protein
MIGRIAVLFCLLLALTTHADKLRYMVAVDTSRSMLPRKPAVVKLVRELVSGGFDNQIAVNDQFTIWVYNEQNYWNRFPIQIWNPEKSELIGEIGAQFIASEIFEKQTRFDAVAYDINRLLLAHPNMVLLLITDGESPITGIDFDVEVNIEIGNLKKTLKSDRRLFVVSLLSLNGKLQSWRVFPADAELTLPKLPPRQDQNQEVAKTKPPALSAEELRQRSLAALAKRPAEPKPKHEAAKPPAVYELPPGAKILTPKPLESVAEASPSPIIDSPIELTTRAVSASSSTSQPVTPLRSPVTTQKPMAVISSQRAATNPDDKKGLGPKVHLETNSQQNVAIAHVKESAKPLDMPPPKTSGVGMAAEVKTSPKTPKTSSNRSLPPASQGNHPSVENSSSNLIWLYCLGAVGGLIALAAGIFLLQRRAHLRGSIISESYSIR